MASSSHEKRRLSSSHEEGLGRGLVGGERLARISLARIGGLNSGDEILDAARATSSLPLMVTRSRLLEQSVDAYLVCRAWLTKYALAEWKDLDTNHASLYFTLRAHQTLHVGVVWSLGAPRASSYRTEPLECTARNDRRPNANGRRTPPIASRGGSARGLQLRARCAPAAHRRPVASARRLASHSDASMTTFATLSSGS